MKERHYLLATAVARVTAAEDCLRMVLPIITDPDVIPEKDLLTVKRLLDKMRSRLHARIDETHDGDESE